MIDTTPKSNRDLTIWAAIAVGVLVRAGLLIAVGDLDCTNDECTYLQVANALLDGKGLVPIRGFLWAPGYPAFLALAGTAGKSHMAMMAKILQICLALVTHLVLVGLARRCFGNRVAAGTAWLFALYPTLVAFTHYLWPETLYIFFFVVAVYALITGLEVNRDTSARLIPLLGSGVAFGLASLVRPVALYFFVFLVLWLAWRGTNFANPGSPPKDRKIAVIFILGCVMTIAGWTVRNWVKYDRVVPVDATIGVNLWRGNATPAVANWDFGFDRRPVDPGNPRGFIECRELPLIDRDRCNTRLALKVIQDNPLRFLRRLPTKLFDLANPTSFVIRHARWGLYGNLSRGAVAVITLVSIVSYSGVALLTILALVAMPRWKLNNPLAAVYRQLFLALGLYTLAIHSVTFGMSRYRLPLIPLALPLVALAWSNRRQLKSLPRTRRRVIVLLWLVLFAAWARRLPPLLDLDPAITRPSSHSSSSATTGDS